MKQGWEIKKLGEVCEFQNGFAFKSGLFTDSGLPILRISNIQDFGIDSTDVVFFNDKSYKENFDRFKVFPGDIVIAMSGGTTGKLGVNNSNITYYLNQRVGKFTPSENILKSYLYFYLQTKSEESLRIAGGAAQPNLSTEQIKSFLIPFPSISEQERIVGILDSAFAKIEALRANAQQNLQNTKDLFQASLKQELTPKQGWKKVTIEDVCTLKSGNSNANNSDTGELPYVKVSDMNIEGNELYITHSSLYVDRIKNKKGIFPIGTTIFPKRGGAIATNKKRITGIEVCCDLNIMGVIPSSKIVPMYLFFFFQGVDLGQLFDGASIPQINNKDIAPLVIGLPTIKEQQAIVEKLDALSERCRVMEENYKQTAILCNNLKQALLKQAFNGEL